MTDVAGTPSPSAPPASADSGGGAAQERSIASLRAAHHAPHALILPTAWDALSALVFQVAGFAAVGTGSQGIAAVHGLPDGQRIPVDEMVDALSRVVQTVTVPVSADIEGGYAIRLEAVYKNVQRLIKTGIAGCNFEDAQAHEGGGLHPILDQVERIRTVRAAAGDLKLPIVINAVIDSYLVTPLPPDPLRVALERAPVYMDAGADCVFVPGMVTRDDIRALVAAVRGPVNVLIRPGVPSADELEELGVKRITFGSGLLRSVTRPLLAMASALASGDLDSYLATFWPNSEFTSLIDRSARGGRGAGRL
jgi:2-methylisocitrate lyase-like PEP mutase family enzyme